MPTDANVLHCLWRSQCVIRENPYTVRIVLIEYQFTFSCIAIEQVSLRMQRTIKLHKHTQTHIVWLLYVRTQFSFQREFLKSIVIHTLILREPEVQSLTPPSFRAWVLAFGAQPKLGQHCAGLSFRFGSTKMENLRSVNTQ